MFSDVLKILSFQAFRMRDDDPTVHFMRKVGNREFVPVILGHQQVKYAKAQMVKGKLRLGKAFTAFVDNFQTAEVDTPWVAEMLQEVGDCKTMVLGLNLLFNNLKIYPKDQKLKDIEKSIAGNLEGEVGQKGFDKAARYFLAQAGDHICLNGVERDKIVKAVDKFTRWGFRVTCAFHYPSAVLSHISSMPLNWAEPGVLMYYSQKLLFFMGWIPGEVIAIRSRLIAEAQRGATGTRPMLNILQREIDTTTSMVSNKAEGAPINVYVFNDKQDPSVSGMDQLVKNAQSITWPQDTFESEIHPYPEPDMAIIRETLGKA